MVRRDRLGVGVGRRRPRARGDGPHARRATTTRAKSAPRTRGWSAWFDPDPAQARVGPAHAGMVLLHPGVSPELAGRPRARGDGPMSTRPTPGCCASAPRTRGWSGDARGAHRARRVGPAHAGMVRLTGIGFFPRTCRPRARGDGPSATRAGSATTSSAPRTRGWSVGVPALVVPAGVGPARAGMVPAPVRRCRSCAGRPRARGDGLTLRHRRP